MRRIAAICAVLVGVVALLVWGTAAGGEGGSYEVRAAFDNGSFLVPGEDVRVAGANVGSVSEVTVSRGDEEVHADGSPEPGKAIVVMSITDPAFQDFRADASCVVRPQSLLGERYVECRPTLPRAPGSEPPPPLETVPDDQEGAGQRFLPLEQNGKTVDLDLVQNIMREPYPDRFRLILNDLGAAVAARGDDLEAIVERADPALRQTNEVLAILARQNRQLASLARNGDKVLAPLARDRKSLSGFINNAAEVGQATAEKSAELEDGLQKLPGFLRELRPTMTALRQFSEQSTPVFADLRTAAPAITRATKALGPFSKAGRTALISLGDAAETAGPDIAASRPVVRDVKQLAEAAVSPSKNLNAFLKSFDDRGGYQKLFETILNQTGAFNGYDQYGHFLRANLQTSSCTRYFIVPESGCAATWGTLESSAASEPSLEELRAQAADADTGRTPSTDATGAQPQTATPAPQLEQPELTPIPPAETPPDVPAPDEAQPPGAAEPDAGPAGPAAGEAALPRRVRLRDARTLLDFLIGPASAGEGKGGGGR